MKHSIKKLLQTLLGIERYLYYFAVFKVYTFRWDSNEKDFFHFVDLMKEDSHVLDVGSNIGVTTVHLSQKAKRGQVYSFEPLPPNIKTFEQVVGYFKLPNVELFKFAVGEENGEVEMVLPEVENVVMQGLSHVVHEDLTDFNEGKRFKTALHRIDSLDFWKDNPIDGIKLDVENFEYFALKGTEALLKRDKPVIYAELWENDNRTNCFDYLGSLGYETKVLVNNQLETYNKAKHQTQNFFFL